MTPLPSNSDPTECVQSPAGDADRKGRLQHFLSELHQLYSGKNRPSDWLAELGSRFEHRKVLVRARRSQFTGELTATFACIAKPEAGNHIAPLAATFTECRQQARTRIARYLANVPDDDPIKCAISLFEAFQHGRRETAHTRVLAWLIDQTKPHDFGSILFKAIWKQITGEAIVGKLEMKVVPEQRIRLHGTKWGRFDILAKGRFPEKSQRSSWRLVIEAKVDAFESEDQLSNYDDWLDSHRVDHDVRVFLTPDGSKPQTSSNWLPLSFVDVAATMRQTLPELKAKNLPGYHFLRYYLTAIMKEICGWSIPVDADSCPDPYGVLQYLNVTT